MSIKTIDEKADDLFVTVYDQVYKQIDHLTRKGALDVTNLDDLFRATMETLDYISSEGRYLTGTQKGELAKQIIVQILKDLIKKKKIDPDIGNNLIMGVELVGPALFKLVTLASKGVIKLIHGTNDPTGTGKAKCCNVL